jgi:hypothetical protein
MASWKLVNICVRNNLRQLLLLYPPICSNDYAKGRLYFILFCPRNTTSLCIHMCWWPIYLISLRSTRAPARCKARLNWENIDLTCEINRKKIFFLDLTPQKSISLLFPPCLVELRCRISTWTTCRCARERSHSTWWLRRITPCVFFCVHSIVSTFAWFCFCLSRLRHISN